MWIRNTGKNSAWPRLAGLSLAWKDKVNDTVLVRLDLCLASRRELGGQHFLLEMQIARI